MARHRGSEAALQPNHRHWLTPDHQTSRHDHRNELSHRCHLQQAGNLEAELSDNEPSDKSSSPTSHHTHCSDMHGGLGRRHLVSVLYQLGQEGGEASHEEAFAGPREAEEEEGGVCGEADDCRDQVFPDRERAGACSSQLVLLQPTMLTVTMIGELVTLCGDNDWRLQLVTLCGTTW